MINKVVILLVTVLWPLSFLTSADEAKTFNNGFTIDLIHRDSPLSPLYNPSLTPSEIITNAVKRSVSRTSRFFFPDKAEEEEEESVLIPDRGDYLMKILIGTPPMESLAVADTGSDLVWIQCLPCEQCYSQNAPIFDPKNSSTFETLTCDSESCRSLSRYGCGSSGECRYYYSYGDRSYTVGELVSDTISFSTSNGGKSMIKYPKTTLGCGHDNDGNFRSTSTGLVGLGGGPLSLVTQLGDAIGHKFSYCLLPFSVNSTSKLKFGSESSTVSRNGVVSTPLISKSPSTYYYLTLEGISIGEKKLQTEQSANNIVIDSGTTLTMLQSDFYDGFESAVKDAVDNSHEPVQDPPEPLRLCYRDISVEDLPDLTFHFSGADVHLQKMNTILKVDNLICLAIVPSDRFSIFGNIAQVNFNVGYDLQEKMVSFYPADCTMDQ
ncbi:aspartic proteinase CDR1-like [Arachis stenosperma]|uniref:aspartic proteinase CDR1-like n=1 Tax=Arachis stenosperma TaxID=217475 RepID=UPI0025AB8F7F|nr:aspartic proteinase CDR1-like [Arachis stenosperma]